MSLLHNLASLLDRRGGRGALGLAATWITRLQSGADVSFFHDRTWIERIGTDYFALGPRFERHPNPREARDGLMRACRDYWFRLYSPKFGDTVVDVGAGDGSDVFAFSKLVGPTGQVLAIEAHPATFGILEDQCRRNRLENVKLCHRAVASESGTAFIENGVNRDLNAVRTKASPGTTPVRASSVDEICDEFSIGRIDFLKMNIEGAEALAIAGMTRAIARTAAACIACHDFLEKESRTKATIVEFLKKSGLDVTLREEDPRDFVRDHVHGLRRT